MPRLSSCLIGLAGLWLVEETIGQFRLLPIGLKTDSVAGVEWIIS
jgi:hypothetical protein